MFFKKHINPIYLLTLITIVPTNVLAYSSSLIAGGDTIGINISTNGILVVGTYDVGGDVLAADSNIRTGDIIISSNNKKIKTIDELMNSIDSKECDKLSIKYKRNNKLYDATLSLKMDNDICKTGLYVKDSITGIGTLTFIDPNTKIFGALGHEILEQSTGKIIDTHSGTIFDSEVINIAKSKDGVPGEKNARYYSNNINGEILENTNKGIFGKYNDSLDNKKEYKVATPSEIVEGEAKILTVLSGTDVQEYEINIKNIFLNQDTKNMIFEITDEELLEKTGGIVQGMSGSPIIQNNKIIGAVTHVVVEKPTRGYGIFITNMLEEAEN